MKENWRAWHRSLAYYEYSVHYSFNGVLDSTYVKSPVASLCFACSSVRKRVRVTMSVLIFSSCSFTPLAAMMMGWLVDNFVKRTLCGKRKPELFQFDCLAVRDVDLGFTRNYKLSTLTDLLQDEDYDTSKYRGDVKKGFRRGGKFLTAFFFCITRRFTGFLYGTGPSYATR